MKISFYVFLFFLCVSGKAIGQAENWQNLSFKENGVFGAAIEKAHAAAKGMKPAKKTVTIALIGNGIDVEHEAIKEAIWINPKEKLNGKDDDKNGWIDDIHGWNFLGKRNDTATLNVISKEGNREYLRLRDKYEQYLFVFDNKAYRFDTVANAVVEIAPPADMAEYRYFQKTLSESELSVAYRSLPLGRSIVWQTHEFDKQLRQQFPNKQLTKTDFQIFLNNHQLTPLETQLSPLVAVMFFSAGTDDWDKMVAFADAKFVPYQQREYDRGQRMIPKDRKIIGDNVEDINDKNYGNNNLLAGNAPQGTMMAGIIAAKGDKSQIKGICENAKIMTLRVDADYGEAYVKDIALAIRYAVDKGADVIQLGNTNTFYPQPYSQWVDDALQYAEKKGVLVVIPMMDLSCNVDEFPFYPNQNLKGKTLSNIITVAASDSLGNPYLWANFSKTQLDLFAPGVEIRSSYLNNKYGVGSGSKYAAAMVTGTAAFIKSYFPKITPEQMRKLLMDNVTDRKDAEVEKQYRFNGKSVKDLFLFSELCASGGILNAEKAFEEAKKLKN
jgi:subtilisin family serine protease